MLKFHIKGIEKLKINKFVFLVTMCLVYILIGMIPGFKIKLVPPVEMSQFNGMIYYFYHNFTNDWRFKVIAALIIATIVSLIIRKMVVKN